MAQSPTQGASGASGATAAAVGDGETRRDFLYLATGAVTGVGALAAVWPLIDQMNPSRDVLALASTEV
ncbi:MAG: ubiquinol-cytochrome c reductase iron-sulfur subunit N-terminal domain-containing protein, partial [Alphaproteobacteria bacterium]